MGRRMLRTGLTTLLITGVTYLISPGIGSISQVIITVTGGYYAP